MKKPIIIALAISAMLLVCVTGGYLVVTSAAWKGAMVAPKATKISATPTLQAMATYTPSVALPTSAVAVQSNTAVPVVAAPTLIPLADFKQVDAGENIAPDIVTKGATLTIGKWSPETVSKISQERATPGCMLLYVHAEQNVRMSILDPAGTELGEYTSSKSVIYVAVLPKDATATISGASFNTNSGRQNVYVALWAVPAKYCSSPAQLDMAAKILAVKFGGAISDTAVMTEASSVWKIRMDARGEDPAEQVVIFGSIGKPSELK